MSVIRWKSLIIMGKYILIFIALFVSEISFSKNTFPIGSDYPVKQIYQGTVAKQVDLTDEFTKMFRTRFKTALSSKITFAGLYASTVWGCGSSGCHSTAFINKQTGKALNKSFTVYYSMQGEVIGEKIEYIDKYSRLIIAAGTDEDTHETFRYYYLLENGELTLINKIPTEKIIDINFKMDL